MKIRNGFVSNSSSSSFVLLGKRINLNDAEQHIKINQKVIFIVEGWDNQIIIECDTLEMLSYVKAYDEIRDGIYYVYLAYHFAFGEMEIDFAQLPRNGKASLIGDDCEQFSVHDVNDMKEFISDEDWNDIEKRALEIQANV